MVTATQSRPCRPAPTWHAVFMAAMPAIVTHARISFRDLDADAREEATQNAICNACQAVARLADLDKLDLVYPSILARYAVAQTKDGRIVGGHLNCKDVSSPYCQRLKGVVIEQLDTTDESWQEILVEDRNATPADLAASRIDFPAWLDTLSRRDRKIALKLAEGERTRDVARRYKVSQGRISQLRSELKVAWEKFTGDEGSGAAVPA